MQTHSHPHPPVQPGHHQQPHPEPDAWLFFKRACRLRCPECGISPLFVPVLKMRCLSDWLNPLDGCPRCGYAYVRENGYFLLSIWGFNYGVVGMLGIIGIFVVADYFHLSNWQMFAYLVPPLPVLNFLFIRHSKSFFLAMDHFFDPHVKGVRGQGPGVSGGEKAVADGSGQ